MNHDDFVDVKNLAEQTCLNFNIHDNGETFKFGDVSEFRIEKQKLNSLLYKKSFKEVEYNRASLKGKRTRGSSCLKSFCEFNLKKAYFDTIPISKAKYDGLMYLLRTDAIKKSYGYFYENLKVEK